MQMIGLVEEGGEGCSCIDVVYLLFIYLLYWAEYWVPSAWYSRLHSARWCPSPSEHKARKTKERSPNSLIAVELCDCYEIISMWQFSILTVSHQLPHLQSHLQPAPAQLLSCVINPPDNYIIFLFTVNTTTKYGEFLHSFYPIILLSHCMFVEFVDRTSWRCFN